MSAFTPRVLLTNDDGALDLEGAALGTYLLLDALRDHGFDVTCVVPLLDESCCGHSTDPEAKLQTDSAYPGMVLCGGYPADCVRLVFENHQDQFPKRPDIVVAGINRGFNTGRSVWTSGTIAAAREGVMRGVPGIAFSAAADADKGDLKRAARQAALIVNRVLLHGEDDWQTDEFRGLLNVNLGERGIVCAYNGIGQHQGPGSDYNLARLGYTTVTQLSVNQDTGEPLEWLTDD